MLLAQVTEATSAAKDLVGTVGIAVAVCVVVLAAVFFMIWKVINWVREDIVKPGMGRHMTFMDGLESTIKAQTSIQQQQADNCKRQTDLLEALRAELALMNKK